MDYSDLFRSFLSSLVSKEAPLEITDYIDSLVSDFNASNEISRLKNELLSKIDAKNTLDTCLKNYVKELSMIIQDLEKSIVSIPKYEPLDHEIILEFGRSLSQTTHPSPYSNEPPIPQDSKMRSSLLFNQVFTESVNIKQEMEEEDISMNWINASSETMESKADFSLLDLDL